MSALRNITKVECIGRDIQRVGWEISHQSCPFAYPRAGTRRPLKVKGNGWTGQARKTVGMILTMVQEGRIARRAMFFFAGTSIDGKGRFEYGMAQKLDPDVPFITIAASEVSSH
ncbi:hypothetical protein ARMGADRAFT_366111 [Armillaria gallica]|uniref:TIP49 P-loop domain-containing protein n=1 Tax=Armillaria gallica TaxID=47427 RepID=A0A2H3DY76_ARMGA|nr:hypothetical protein ARMGADRAFT_366111 [Armillaria gallica]